MNYYDFNGSVVEDEDCCLVWSVGDVCPECKTHVENVETEHHERDVFNHTHGHATVPAGFTTYDRCECGKIEIAFDEDGDIESLEFDGNKFERFYIGWRRVNAIQKG